MSFSLVPTHEILSYPVIPPLIPSSSFHWLSISCSKRMKVVFTPTDFKILSTWVKPHPFWIIIFCLLVFLFFNRWLRGLGLDVLGSVVHVLGLDGTWKRWQCLIVLLTQNIGLVSQLPIWGHPISMLSHMDMHPHTHLCHSCYHEWERKTSQDLFMWSWGCCFQVIGHCQENAKTHFKRMTKEK